MTNKEIKVAFLGVSGVGKTNLINRYVKGSYNEYENTTITSTYMSKTIIYGGKDYIFNIWDTSGSEKLRSLTKLFVKDAKIIVLVYDITFKESFLELQFWLDFILENVSQKILLVLVGNKKDLNNNIKIKESVGENFAKVIKASFAQVSAKNNDDNWKYFFDDILKDYIKYTTENEEKKYYSYDSYIVINKKNDDDDDYDDDDLLP